VSAGRPLFSHEHDRQSRHPTSLLHLRDFASQLSIHFYCHSPAFDKSWHEAGILRKTHGCSTRLIIAFCSRSLSLSNSSAPASGATWNGAPKIARSFANGRGTPKRSQLFSRQQLEYSMWIGTMGAPLFWARKITPCV